MKTIKHGIKVVVINRLGTFEGKMESSTKSVTKEELVEAIEALQKSINRINSFVMIDTDGYEVSFPESVVKESVFKFKLFSEIVQ